MIRFPRDKTFAQPINWITTLFMIALHIGAVGALFLFSWKGLALAVLLLWVSGSPGIGMGYHRLLTHRGYKTPKWVEYSLTVCGTLALQGGPIEWVATHRLHHQNTDKEGDPHSPRDGGLWAHMGWILTGRAMHSNASDLLPFVPDLRKDKFHRWISKWHWVPFTVLALAILAMGGWSCLLWAVFLRTVIGLHATWLVNSATHMWGSRRFVTDDTSRNSIWVALLTFGEGWHNNHHAVPQSARHGLTWYELDLNWYGICVLRALGLARDIRKHKNWQGAAMAPLVLTSPRYPATLADLGSRAGDGQAQDFHHCHGCAATGYQRKHQSAATAIFPARDRPVGLFASAARPGRAALESTPEKDLRIPNSSE